MAEISWTESALVDLEAVAEYIALDNPNAAAKLVDSVFTKTDRLSDFPDSGRVIEELAEFNYRELIINPVRVVYKNSGTMVVILGVVRQERDLLRYISRL